MTHAMAKAAGNPHAVSFGDAIAAPSERPRPVKMMMTETTVSLSELLGSTTKFVLCSGGRRCCKSFFVFITAIVLSITGILSARFDFDNPRTALAGEAGESHGVLRNELKRTHYQIPT